MNYSQEEIYGDTIWIYPYGNQTWLDTISDNDFVVYVSAWTDTNDYLIDTVKSAVGNRIVIGYNHEYSLDFRKDKKPWFVLKFDKKKDLFPIIYGTDLWQKSNLDIINNIIINQKFERFVVEMSINSGDQFNNMFYMIIDAQGRIKYIGTMSSWGGGGPDGMPFLTEDENMYVTCNELYNFVLDTAISLTEYVTMAHTLSGIQSTEEYVQPHGLRYLSNNYFLVVFNRFHNKPKNNAIILNTDSIVLDRFGYFGLVEDIDAILLFEDIEKLNASFLYDLEREVLIMIKKDSIPVIEETGLYEMAGMQENFEPSSDFLFIDFGFYGPYEFYLSPNDSIIYYREEKIH